VLQGKTLQSALDAMPSRKDIRALVQAEREAQATQGANMSTADRVASANAKLSTRGGTRPRGGRREKEKAARRAAAASGGGN